MYKKQISLAAVAAFSLTLLACGEDRTETASAPGEKAETEQAGSAPTTPPAGDRAVNNPGAAPGASGTAQAPGSGATGSTQQAARSPDISAYQGRTYARERVSLRLNEDNTFLMENREGNEKVQGRYSFQNGILTFTDAKGATGTPNQFPLECRLQSTGPDGFRLAESNGSCSHLKGETFKAASG